MIGSEDRGSAWTRALLGMPAREVHVCGDYTMLSLVKELCHVTGEELHVHEYKRLSPLKFSPPLSAWSQIKRYVFNHFFLGDSTRVHKAYGLSGIYTAAIVSSHFPVRTSIR